MDSQSVTDPRQELIAILQLAYSGERAAGYAYRGHWRSVSDPEERVAIRTIEDEEWHHRRQVGEMLRDLGAGPNPWREVKTFLIGKTLGALCHVSGWLAPMYGAGRLESHNIGEYELAARLAVASGRADLVDCLLTMAEVEWEHERFFREQVAGHWLLRVLPMWEPPPPPR